MQERKIQFGASVILTCALFSILLFRGPGILGKLHQDFSAPARTSSVLHSLKVEFASFIKEWNKAVAVSKNGV